MLHVITEVGKSGKQEREKRHFPDVQNQPSVTKYRARGRRYIPHGIGDEFEFTPHPQHISPDHKYNGLDWKSSLRPIGSPPHGNDYPAEESWPNNWRSLKTYPENHIDEKLFLIQDEDNKAGWINQRTMKEWMLYPEGPGYDSTLRATWDGVHKASEITEREVTHSMRFGRGRIVADKRNGLSVAAPGDKNYQVVEYSPEFHKYGSTLPVVNFGGNAKKQADTFVPLLELPPIPQETFASKEKMRKLMDEIGSVLALNKWRPATPLSIPPNNIHGQSSHQAQNAQSSEALDAKNTSLNASK